MNLFAVSWNVTELSLVRMENELRRMVGVYPTMDARTLSKFGSADGVIKLVSMSNRADSIAPRVYSHESRGTFTMYCGLPVDPHNDCVAHDAASIEQHWSGVKDRLEGTYAVIRATQFPPTLEIQTDLLAGEAVYYSRYGAGWIISNSVLLIERLSTYRALDPLGVSMFLSLGQPLDERTFREGIHVLSGAQRWRWTVDSAEPHISSYNSIAELVKQPRIALREMSFAKLGSDLAASLKSLDSQFNELICPLTGGKDSRVIAALLIQAGIKARYSTFGDEAGYDVRIAAKIAKQFGLSHDVLKIDDTDVADNWDAMCLPSIRSTDGMRSLYLLAGVLKPLSDTRPAKDVYLWGACGEAARCFYGRLPFLREEISTQGIVAAIATNNPANSSQLVRSHALEAGATWLNHWISECVEQGIATLDIPDVFGTFMIDGRRLSNNGRALAGFRDTFTPYATPAFLNAAFALSPLQRYTEPLHFGLVRHLVPDLHKVELAKDNWYPQNALLNYVRQGVNLRMKRYAKSIRRRTQRVYHSKSRYAYDDSNFHRVSWFESQRSKIRELALDSGASPVWDFVDKDAFERIMSDKVEPVARSRSLKLLFHIATLLYYQCDSERVVRPGKQNRPNEIHPMSGMA